MDAFVVQPIRASQDPDHEHFRALYVRVRNVLEARGYTCLRADDVERSGAITKEIIAHLASADLVVADLTDLNPNVYYELGVRHALRGSGTMLLLDEARTKEIPFDLSAYRVIRFEGTVPGIARLEDSLIEAVDQQTEFGPASDNPVHDWLPELPHDALAAADGSEDGELRKALKEQEQEVARYRDRFGILETPQHTSTPLNVVMLAVAAARDGNTPAQLTREAEQAVQARDISGFLGVIRRIFENEVRIEKSEAIIFSYGADRLGLSAVGRAILDYAIDYLDDDELEQAILARAAHSSDPGERVRAREMLAQRSGLRLSPNGEIFVPAEMTKTGSWDLALLMDVLDSGGDHREAFAIAFSWAVSAPKNSVARRHLARGYASLGKRDIALKVFRYALAAPDVTDTTARWLGNEYHNYEEFVNALEAFALSARLDPDDGNLFAHAADELSIALRDRLLGRTPIDNRHLPEVVTNEDFEKCAYASVSCSTVNEESIRRLEASGRRLDVQVDLSIQNGDMDLMSRHQFVTTLYDNLASKATEPIENPPKEGWPDLREGAEWQRLANLGLSVSDGTSPS